MDMAAGREPLTKDRRKEVFLALVEAQDRALGTELARRLVASRFNVSEAQVRQIEDEGLEHDWPPL